MTVFSSLFPIGAILRTMSPMESFFGRLKCELLDLVALCPDASTVSRMISGYIDAYNHRHYQYALAGLTPSEYYTYVTTGIYPVDNYYGIKATELMPIQALIAARRRAAEEKAQKVQRGQRKETRYGSRKEKGPRIRHSKGSTHLAPRNSEVDPLQRTCASTDIPSERNS